jgi:predicted MFS family arabinose efflux permease
MKKALNNNQYKLLLCTMVLSGFQQGVVNGILYRVTTHTIYVDPKNSQDSDKKIALTMIVYGVSAVIFAHILSKLTDKYRSKVFVRSFTVFCVFTFGFMVLTYHLQLFGLAFATAAFWGIYEVTGYHLVNYILSKHHDSIGSYSVYKIVMNISTCLPLVLVIYLDTELFFIVQGALILVVALIGSFYSGEDSRKELLIADRKTLTTGSK